MRPPSIPCPCRPSRATAFAAAATCILVLAGCREFGLSQPHQAPVVNDLYPEASFAWNELTIVGENFDPEPENNQILLANGMTVRARKKDGDEKVVPSTTHLYITIPESLQVEGPVSVTTPAGTSEPSTKTFYPLGYGHPVYGTGVVNVRFRHKPVGLFDSAETVIIASTLFDQLVNDAGQFVRMDGRPIAFGRAPSEGQALVSVKTAAGKGVLHLVDGTNGQVLASSKPRDTVDALVVDSPIGQPIRTIGVTMYGKPNLYTWIEKDGVLEPQETPLAEVTRVTGAAADSQGAVYLVATTTSGSTVQTALSRVMAAGKLMPLWKPHDDTTDPTGVMAVVQTPDGPEAALAMADGDVIFVRLSDGFARHQLLVSFGKIGDLTPGTTPGKVVLTKPDDGSMMQYDVPTLGIDWTVQIRGEPTVLDVAADLDEIAVANNEDNGVDIVQASTGLWLGRISFGLGLGGTDQAEGGLVAPYAYDPREPERPWVIHVLARAAGMVLELDASSLDVLRTYELAVRDPADETVEFSQAQRLMVTHDLQTLVVHAKELGLLEEVVDEETGETTTRERILVRNLPVAPTHVAPLPDNGVVVGNPTSVGLYQWTGDDPKARTLAYSGGVPIPKDSTLEALAVWKDAAGKPLILIVRSTLAGYVSDFYDPSVLALGGAPRNRVAMDTDLGDFLGTAMTFEGPVLAFGRSMCTLYGNPSATMISWDNILAAPENAFYLPSELNGPTMMGGAPDGRYIAWMSERQGVHVVRLVEYDPHYWEEPYAYVWSTYQLESRGSSLTFDPSGQWLYVTVPKLDLLSVFQ